MFSKHSLDTIIAKEAEQDNPYHRFWQSKQHAKDKRKRVSSQKEKEAGGLCRATIAALVKLSYRRVLLILYQG